MLIDTTPAIPSTFSPALDAASKKPAVAPHDDDATPAAQFSVAWQQAFALADQQAPALADNLQRLSRASPEALPLYLQNVTEQSRRELSAANAQLANVMNSGRPDESSKGLLENFGEVLTKANNRNVSQNEAYLGKYSQYMVALSKLMAEINSHVKAETGKDNEGKSNINGSLIYKSLVAFRNEWAGDKGVIRSFATQAEADAAKTRFRSRTVDVQQEGGKFNLRFSIDQFQPIMSAIAWQPGDDKKLMDNLRKGADENGADAWHWTKAGNMNAHSVQSLTLALNDVQKTHQTDLDLLLNDFSRSVSQFDNLVKLYSSLATALTETCKSFL